MLRMKTVSFLVLLSSAVVGAKKPFSLRPKTTSPLVATSKQDALLSQIPRGGSGFDPDIVSNIFLGTYGMNAVVGLVAPEQLARGYRMIADEFDRFVIQGICAIGANTVLLLYLQLFQSMPFEEAMGWSTLPYIGQEVFKFINRKHELVGFKRESSIFMLGLNVLVMFAGLTNAETAEPAIKFYGLWSLFNAVPLIFNPDSWGRNFIGLDSRSGGNTLLLAQAGGFLLAHGLAVTLQAFDITNNLERTIGWTAIAAAATMSHQILSKRIEYAGLERSGAWIWVAINGVVGASLLAEEGGGTKRATVAKKPSSSYTSSYSSYTSGSSSSSSNTRSRPKRTRPRPRPRPPPRY